MFDDDELEEVREDRASWYGLDHETARALRESRRFRFGASFAGAAVFLVFLVVLLASIGTAPAASVSNVGGFQVDVGRIVGQDVAFYPAAGESAACQNTSPDRTPEAGQQALPVVESEIGQARIPATSNIQIIKDIRTPSTLSMLPDVFRIRLNRYNVPSNPIYPPLAQPGDYGDSDGFTERGSERAWTNEVAFDGIEQVVPSQDDQGYRSFNRLRSNNQTQGTTGGTLTVDGFADIRYGTADTTPYPGVGGGNPNRYIDQVQFAGDSSGFTGNDSGGYRDGTATVFGNVSQGTTESIVVDAVGAPPIFPDAEASSYAFSDGITDSFDYRVAGVSYAGISSSSGANDGYLDNTDQHTTTLPTGDSSGITVSAERNDISSFLGNGQADVIGDTGAMSPTNLGCGSKCGEQELWINQVDWDGNSYNTPEGCSLGEGDDHTHSDASGYQDYTDGYWTANQPFVPTTTHTLQVQMDHSDDARAENGGPYNIWAWIDWDDDGDYDGTTPGGQSITEFYPVQTDIGSGNGLPDHNCPDNTYANSSITVPGNVFTDPATYRDFQNGSEPGPVSMRIVAAYEGNCPTTAGPGQDFSLFNGCGGEKEDYTVDVEEPASHFAAYADWDQDSDLSDANEHIDMPDGHRNQGGFSFSVSDTITVPAGALGGSTLLRVTHAAGYPSVQTVEPGPAMGSNAFVGETEDYTVEIESDGTANIKAWVDWDQDGDLTDANEEIDLGQDSFPSTNGSFSLGPQSFTVPAGAEAGTTLLRVGLVMDGIEPTPGLGTGSGEYEDYTVHVDPDEDAHVRAWIDWDQSNTLDAGELYDLGTYGPSTYLNNQPFTASTSVGTVPSTAPSGVTLMRVTTSLGDLPGSTPGAPDTFFGESEDYTVVVGPQTEPPDYAQNVTLGDATFRLTDLTADSIEVQTAVIDEDYSQNSTQYPTLTRDGEFIISGEIVDIRNLNAQAHYLSFGSMDMPYLNLSVSYNPTTPQVKSDNTCLGMA